MTANTPATDPIPATDPPRPDDVASGAARRDTWTVAVVVLAALALVASIVGVGLGARAVDESKRTVAATDGGDEAPATVGVEVSEFAIAPADIVAETGGTLRVTNAGTATHDFGIDGTDVMSPMLDAGGTAEVSLAGIEPGTYRVLCHVPGHASAGMTATLKVVAAGGAPTAAPPVSTAAKATSADDMDAAMAGVIKAFPAKTDGAGAQPLAPTVLADGTKQFELTAKTVDWEVEPGRTVEAWTYNGTVPAPTIQVAPGDRVQVVLTNELTESTSIHFHGLITPNSQDGVPDITQQPVKPGETFTYTFTAQPTPAVGMYHSHQNAVKQVPNGMAGAFLVGDEPVPAGVSIARKEVLMLNDAGTIGFSINGKSFPATAPIVAKLGDWIEVSYLNEGEMAHPMHLHSLTQKVIAKDGYPLPAPYDADTILVGPGERYTVLVKADNPGTWAWHCHILSHSERTDGRMFGMVTAMIVEP